MNMIEVKNLSKRYGKFTAVDNISFHVEKGSVVGFVGKNGAGKTTTIRCMLDFLKPSSGSITVNGLNAQRQSAQIKSFLGYMPSDTSFYENLSCNDIFRLSCSISGMPMDKAAELCSYFELDASKKFKDLSLGNKKKVSIIQALLKNAQILVLDEPTSGLDPLMQTRFFDLLMNLKQQGMTIFLSSHNLSEVQKYCDRALIIKDGKIVDDLDMRSLVPTLQQIVTYTTKDGTQHKFENTEDINLLVKKLSELDLAQLEIKYASVEDEFMKYYKE